MKNLFTLYVKDYFPEMAKITLPNIERYAKKIGANFHLITERKFPEWPVTYEKLQIHELGKDADWNIHVDADMLIHPDFWDVTKASDPRCVSFLHAYDAKEWFKPDEYFLRDGRERGVTSNFVVVHRMCHDFWTPFDVPFEVAKHGTKRLHGIDDYCFSRNLAKYGLKDCGILPNPRYHWQIVHLCTGGNPQKEIILEHAQKVLKDWNLL